MAPAPETGYADAGEISFELERLTLTPEHQLELSGQWFGVRGRRFVRPTLTLIGARKRTRLLADLEHKPWAAQDGEAWLVSFPLRVPADEVLELELAVAPDIAVTIPPPPELAQLPPKRRSSRGAVVASRDRPPRSSAPAGNDPSPHGELDAAAQQRARIESLEEQLRHAARAEAELRSALSRRDAAVEQLEALIEQRAAAERGQATEADRQAAARELATALRERDEAAAARDQARAERDHAVAARDHAVAERDQALAAPGPPLFAPLPRPAMARPSHQPAVPRRNPARRGIVWAGRVFALIVLLVAVIAIAIIIRSA